MLSYQHAYHAGNLADVHKHAVLAWVLDYMTRKPKALSYLETHAGRGLYDLSDAAARKTGEAAKGIGVARAWFDAAHPYARVLARVQATHGVQAYPGSPLVAQTLLRDMDRLHLAELHPAEYAALERLRSPQTRLYRQDGFEMAQSLSPPSPRRGVMLVDPSWEVKTDYQSVPKTLNGVLRKWNVAVIVLWYPILQDAPHIPMLAALRDVTVDALVHELRFPPVRPGHRMIGSGLWIANPPWGLQDSLHPLEARFATL